jgi:Ca2+-binding EF-hand superfamily protein
MSSAGLAEFLATVASVQQEVESLRYNLCVLPSFEPYCSFKLIDRAGKGHITALDLKEFLSTTGLSYETGLLQRVIEHYSISHYGRMSLHEFTQAVLPATSAVVRDSVLCRPAFACLARAAMLGLQALLCKELEMQELLWTNSVGSFEDGDEMFRLLSPMRLPVNAKALLKFMTKEGCPVTLEDAECLVKRFDLDKDAFVSFEEFSRAMVGPSMRSARRSIRSELRQADLRLQETGDWPGDTKRSNAFSFATSKNL